MSTGEVDTADVDLTISYAERVRTMTESVLPDVAARFYQETGLDNQGEIVDALWAALTIALKRAYILGVDYGVDEARAQMLEHGFPVPGRKPLEIDLTI